MPLNLENSNKEKNFSSYIRKFYDSKAKKVSSGNYEHFRWFSTKKKRKQYFFTKQSLLFHFRDLSFKDCLDVGCGPGTWTQILLQKYPSASFDCIDISKEMLYQFQSKLKRQNVKTNIKIIVNSFLEQKFNKKYDFIFSSRCIEYISNKPKVINKMYDLLQESGRLIIVTSPPHPFVLFIKKILGKKMNYYHTKRISVKQIKYLLEESGFINIKFYPILFSDFFLVPSSFLFNWLYRKKWGILSKMFATSYVVKCRKPENV